MNVKVCCNCGQQVAFIKDYGSVKDYVDLDSLTRSGYEVMMGAELVEEENLINCCSGREDCSFAKNLSLQSGMMRLDQNQPRSCPSGVESEVSIVDLEESEGDEDEFTF